MLITIKKLLYLIKKYETPVRVFINVDWSSRKLYKTTTRVQDQVIIERIDTVNQLKRKHYIIMYYNMRLH